MKIAEVTLEEAPRHARLYHNKGKPVVVERLFRGILDADAEQPCALIGIVGYLCAIPQESCAWFNQTRGTDEDPIIHCNFAVMAAAPGATDEAITAWRSAIAFRPDYIDRYSNLARMLVAQSEADDTAHRERAFHHAPAHFEIRIHLASALQANGALSDAIEAWKPVLDQAPTHVFVLANLTNAYRELGRTGEAAVISERAIAADPNNAASYINRGNTYLAQGEFEAAERRYVRGTECDPRDNTKLETVDYGKARLF